MFENDMSKFEATQRECLLALEFMVYQRVFQACGRVLHRSKIEAYYREYGREKPLKAGQRLRVQVVRVEAGRGRIGLDFPRAQAAQVSRALEGYAVGETVAGWVRSIGAEGAYIALDEGVEGFVPSCDLGGLGASIRQGSVVRGTVARIDKEKNRIEIAPG